jgi:hypothetical protein
MIFSSEMPLRESLFTRILCLFLFILTVSGPVTSCSLNCGFDSHHLGQCRPLTSDLKSVQIGGFGTCSSAAKSRSLQIACAANSGSSAACTSRSDKSGYFVVLVPDNAGGNFYDSNYSKNGGNGPIGDCQTLWNALNLPEANRPTDISGIYHGDPVQNDFVSCDDTKGCTAVSTNCLSSWDPAIRIPTGQAATIENGKYLACGFIDSPYVDGTAAQGAPPLTGLPAGLIATSFPNAFMSIVVKNPATRPILFDHWVDFQGGTDRCSATTNSRKLSLTCDPSSGTNSACTTRSDASGYYTVIVPNNNGGTFVDGAVGLLANCGELWTAMNAADGSRPQDITAFYHGDPAASDAVVCDDVSGCRATSPDCFSGWDRLAQRPGGQAASIANGSYLICAFIDSPYTDGTPAQGSPPAPGLPAGLIGTSSAASYTPLVISNASGTFLNLNSWTDY